MPRTRSGNAELETPQDLTYRRNRGNDPLDSKKRRARSEPAPPPTEFLVAASNLGLATLTPLPVMYQPGKMARTPTQDNLAIAQDDPRTETREELQDRLDREAQEQDRRAEAQKNFNLGNFQTPSRQGGLINPEASPAVVPSFPPLAELSLVDREQFSTAPTLKPNILPDRGTSRTNKEMQEEERQDKERNRQEQEDRIRKRQEREDKERSKFIRETGTWRKTAYPPDRDEDVHEERRRSNEEERKDRDFRRRQIEGGGRGGS